MPAPALHTPLAHGQPLADAIDALLPQTQCTRCGFEGCRPYAEALAAGRTAANRCPPGGQSGADALARLLQHPALPLDPECGAPGPLRVARIDEAHCIGCTLCIQACPVDAIVGANKHMHTVLAEQCTGCELCIPPCPVDCIDLPLAAQSWTPARAQQARLDHQQRQQRLARQHGQTEGAVARNLANKAPVAAEAQSDAGARRQVLADVMARARARRQQHHERHPTR